MMTYWAFSPQLGAFPQLDPLHLGRWQPPLSLHTQEHPYALVLTSSLDRTPTGAPM